MFLFPEDIQLRQQRLRLRALPHTFTAAAQP
jgi:hypothetical protein